MSLTPEGLPVISDDLLNVYDRDIDRVVLEDRIDNTLEESLRRIERDNPNLVKHVREIAEIFNEEEASMYVTGFINCYDLLRRQAEANKLEAAQDKR